MKEREKKKAVSSEDILKLLDVCYSKVNEGIEHISPSIEEFAESYLSRNPDCGKAAKSMINHQIAKCTTSGFITGLGGIVSLPVAIPANVANVLYVQMRMIACTAYLAGLDTNSDQVQTLVYACLAGVSVNGFVKKAGIKTGEKVANNLIRRIPATTLTKINQRIGFRFITKFGETGVINLGKLIPGVGAVINGGFDLVETKIIGKRAYNMFFQGDFSMKNDELDDDILEVSDIEIVDSLGTENNVL